MTLVSGSGVWLYKVSDCTPLPGTVSIAQGQSVVSTEKDLTLSYGGYSRNW